MESLQDSLPQILDEIKAGLQKNELFAKIIPDFEDCEKVIKMIANATAPRGQNRIQNRHTLNQAIYRALRNI